MKRQSVPNIYDAMKYTPWFTWRECKFCQQEFRREKGWQFVLQQGGGGGFNVYSYSCKQCSGTIDILNKNIKDWFTNNRPMLAPDYITEELSKND